MYQLQGGRGVLAPCPAAEGQSWEGTRVSNVQDQWHTSRDTSFQQELIVSVGQSLVSVMNLVVQKAKGKA